MSNILQTSLKKCGPRRHYGHTFSTSIQNSFVFLDSVNSLFLHIVFHTSFGLEVQGVLDWVVMTRSYVVVALIVRLSHLLLLQFVLAYDGTY